MKTVSFLILITMSTMAVSQTTLSFGSGLYQVSNEQFGRPEGVSIGVSKLFSSQKIPRLGLQAGFTYDYFSGNNGQRAFFRTLSKGSGLAFSADLSFALVQKENFEWRLNNGVFMSHYNIHFRDFTEMEDGNGNRIRNFFNESDEIDSRLGYRLSTSLHGNSKMEIGW